jgi:hypothetical protein
VDLTPVKIADQSNVLKLTILWLKPGGFLAGMVMRRQMQPVFRFIDQE